MTESTFKFKVGMTCSGCSGAITRILSKNTGVSGFDVSLENQTVIVRSSTLSQDQVFDIIKKAGKPTEIIP